MTILINSVEIAEGAIATEMQHHPAPALAVARAQATLALVVRELLIQEAARLGVTAEETGAGANRSPAEATIDALLAREVRTPEPDAETCRRYYANNRRHFRAPDLMEAQHILFAALPGDADARAATRLAAEKVLAQLQSSPEKFGALARAHSACPSKEVGGNLGQLQRGSTVPEFETYLFSLDEGEICAAPVETRYGFHIIRLNRRIAGRDLPFETIEKRIAEYLRDCAWHNAVRQYVQILAGRAQVSGVDLPFADSPLVQ
ncbi:MAG: peptidylprolyl isomerase [Rhodospirillales bacterium]|nr:peptidylprolyl isomerase [Rhodospirillales bacterium]